MREENTKLSRFLSMILRHHPEVIGIELDSHGWADIDRLIEGVNRSGKYIDRDLLEKIVAEDKKQRYSISPDKKCVRANQGHSVHVDVELSEERPPDILYHGPAEKYVDSIEKKGLLPRGRLYVHLSRDRETAISVGRRHGSPIVYRIDSQRMYLDGISFYRSENDVWLVKYVPFEYMIME